MDERGLLVGLLAGFITGIIVMLLVNIWVNQMLERRGEYRVLRDDEGRIVGVKYD